MYIQIVHFINPIIAILQKLYYFGSVYKKNTSFTDGGMLCVEEDLHVYYPHECSAHMIVLFAERKNPCILFTIVYTTLRRYDFFLGSYVVSGLFKMLKMT